MRRPRSHCLAAFSLVLVAAGSAAGVARADDRGGAVATNDTEARKHFEAGVAYLQDPEGQRFEEAYNEFKVSYELSHAAKVLGNLGLCAMKLERDGEAIDAYTRYLAEVPEIDPEEKVQIQKDLAVLGESAARVSIRVHEPGASLYDSRVPVRGANVVNVYDAAIGAHDYRLRPGHHLIVVKVAGVEHARWEFTAAAGASLVHDFTPAAPGGPGSAGSSAALDASTSGAGAPAGSASSSRVAPLVVTGIGAATLVAGAVVGVVALGKVHDLERACPNDACTSPSFGDDVDSARGLVRATDVLLIAGSVVTATGVVWYLLSGSSAAATSRTARVARATAGCDRAGCVGALRIDLP